MTSFSMYITSELLSNALYNIQDLKNIYWYFGTSVKQVIQCYKYSINKLPIFQ